MAVKRLAILGSTGSIGRSTLDVVASKPDRFRVVALAAGRNLELLAEQAERFRPDLVSVADADGAGEIRGRLGGRVKVFHGREGLVEAARHPEVDLVVCGLVGAMGLPPTWYKSAPYRARAASDPRGVLAEFGVEVPEDVEVRVWDSNAELRYMVLPERPAGTEGLSEDELAALVTRDSMVGVAKVAPPEG